VWTLSGLEIPPMKSPGGSPLGTQPRTLVSATTSLPHKTSSLCGSTLRWGLVPYWAKDIKIGYSLINAKAETVAEKPAFREAFKSRRCLIAADGFYEWKKLDAKTKQPYAITMKDRSVFGFAGLWERCKDKASGEVVRSCTIITTRPNEVCASIHDRMPVIVAPENYGNWPGEEEADPVRLLQMLKPFPADAMTAFPVDARVGNVKNNDAALIESPNVALIS
jgi:putative SOS response-associated peptidase YedK